MRVAWRGAVWLTLAAIVCAAVLALVWSVTESRIAANETERARNQLLRTLPDIDFDNDPLTDLISVTAPDLLGTDDQVQVHLVRQRGSLVAAVVEAVAPDGYVGPVFLLVGIAHDGRVSGVSVLRHNETPGLGDRVEPEKSDWLRQFNGKSLETPPLEMWSVKRDGGEFDQLTGATVTTRTIVSAVRDAQIYFQQNQDRIAAHPEPPPPGDTQ
jgi:electron transport complex protein RnfG